MTNKKITPEMVLARLSDKPKIQADIARELECYRSTPAKHLKKLEQDGLVKQTPEVWIRTEGRKAQVAKPVVAHNNVIHIEQKPTNIQEIIERVYDYHYFIVGFTDDDHYDVYEKVGGSHYSVGCTLKSLVDELIELCVDVDEKQNTEDDIAKIAALNKKIEIFAKTYDIIGGATTVMERLSAAKEKEEAEEAKEKAKEEKKKK